MLRIVLCSVGSLAVLGMIDTAAASGSMRCGQYLIESGGRSGPKRYEVLKKCGEPTFKEGSAWVYDKGGRTSRLVFNQSGILDRIE